MSDFTKDIQSLATFTRNYSEIIKQIKAQGKPLLLTVDGQAEIVVQDAAAYQKLLDKINDLETQKGTAQQSFQDTDTCKLLDLYGAAADIEFADIEFNVDEQGISDRLDDDLIGTFDE